MKYREINLEFRIPQPEWNLKRFSTRWLPTPGNVLFTLLVVAGLIWANSAGALPLRAPAAAGTSTGTIAYQGRLADADGNPLTDTYNMSFRLYDVSSGGVFLWEEQWTGSNGVQVSDGLFNVMLGSLTPIPQSVITEHDSLFLGITVGTDDEMTPRVQLGSVPFAVQALTVPDGSITQAKLADNAVTSAKIQDGQVTEAKLAFPFVTRSVNLCFTPYFVCDGVVSDFNRATLGSNQIWSGSFSFTPFDRGLVSVIGRIDLADDGTTFGAVPVAVWLESNDTARFSAIVPDRYFNTVNSRLIVTVVGR